MTNLNTHLRSKNGYVVIIVMILLAGITSLALAAGHRALGRRTRAVYFLERIRTRHSALSGLTVAHELIQSDSTPWDGSGDPWHAPVNFKLGTVSVIIEIQDEQSRLNVNQLLLSSGHINQPLMKTMNHLFPSQHNIDQTWQIKLKEWQSIHGYAPVSTDTALALLKLGQDNNSKTRLTWIGSGRININTASATLLEALGGHDFRVTIEDRRRDSPIRSLFDLDQGENLYQGILPVVDVKTSYFRVHISATEKFVTGHVEALICRQADRLLIIRQKEWWS